MTPFGWTIAEKREFKSCYKKALGHVMKREWELAYPWVRTLLDKWHNGGYLASDVAAHLAHIENDESAGVHVMRAHLNGTGYYFWKHCSPEARMHLRLAAEMGHVYGTFLLGRVLKSQKEKGSFRYLLYAAQHNCEEACVALAQSYADGCDVERDYHLAALWCQRGRHYGIDLFSELMDDHPMEVCPFGRWQPTREYHRLVPRSIRQCMMVWMLVAKRKGLCRDVALLIVELVCTKGGAYI